MRPLREGCEGVCVANERVFAAGSRSTKTLGVAKSGAAVAPGCAERLGADELSRSQAVGVGAGELSRAAS